MSDWDEKADVVVVGFGGAGACAALEARAAGVDVLVLDRFGGGGATAISGGVVYAGQTHIQASAGIEDHTDEMFAYLSEEVGEVVRPETLRRFCEQSPGNLKWLEGHGVPFEGSLCPVKTSYPTDDYYLYYSGNEGFSPYKDKARPAPRGHRAKGKGLPGQNFYEPLRASALRAGVRTSYQTRATELIVEGGEVAGVVVQRIESPIWARIHRRLSQAAIKLNPYSPKTARRWRGWVSGIEARHGLRRRIGGRVVLSAGGFIYNRDMVKAHAPGYRPGMPLGTPGDDGSGILLGQSVGGGTARMDRVSAWRFINPPPAFTRGMLVNGKGERYINEMMYGAAVGEAMVERQDGRAYLIIDQALWDLAKKQCKRGEAQWFQRAPALLNLYTNNRKADSIEGLARACKMDGLAAQLEAYNAQTEDAFGKPMSSYQALTQGPYYAINCSIDSKRFPCPTLTLGGLVVDEDTGAVMGESGPISGLYAAGRNAVGVCSQQYVSGLSIADCVFSGRRAGRSVASQAQAASVREGNTAA